MKSTNLYRARLLGSCACLIFGVNAFAQQPGHTVLGKPDVLIVAGDLAPQQRDQLLEAARKFYEFWNTADPATLQSVISPRFVDRALPAGRPQGPTGPLIAIQNFKRAVPDLRCEITQQIVVSDRVVSHLRFTGHFSGTFAGTKGQGQTVDFIATDILRIQQGRITDNWHLEDNLTFLQQIGQVKH